MSYILDALRKADAQRARDPARGIHAQPAVASPGARSYRGREQWLWGAVAALVLASAAWLWSSADSTATPPVAAAPAVRVEAAAAAPVVPPADVVLPAAPAMAIAPPVQRRPAPVPAQQSTVAAAPASPPPPPTPTPTPAPAAAPSPSPAPAADRTYSLAELPADVQQALPKFAVSGGVYSENVAQRMLIVNGQVFNEGSEIAPGVVLEQIRAKTAMLKFRGLRISQPY